MQKYLILIILLNFWSVECQNFSSCDYYQFLEPGRVYQLSSLGFRYGRPAPLYVQMLLSRFKRKAYPEKCQSSSCIQNQIQEWNYIRNLQIQSKISIDSITALANAIRALFHVHKQNYKLFFSLQLVNIIFYFFLKKTYRNTNCRYAAEAPYGYKITASCRLAYLLPVRLFFIHKS